METTPAGRIRMFRESKGFKTATSFAEAVGIKVGTLSSIETGRTAPGFEILSAIVSAFPDLDMHWLLTGAGSMLRDGRALTPLPSPPTDPQPPSVVAMQASSTEVDDAERARYWKQIAEERGRQLEEARERELWYRELVAKKPEDNDEAATRRGAMRVAA